MKKNKLLIFLVLLAFLSVVFYAKDNFFNRYSSNDNITTLEEKRSSISIYMYNSQNKNYDISKVDKKDLIIDEGDYIEEIIKLSPFSNNNYKFLAAYNINRNDKNTLIVKLNSAFSKLDSKTMNNFANSVKETLKNNFENLEDIIIEIDSN